MEILLYSLNDQHKNKRIKHHDILEFTKGTSVCKYLKIIRNVVKTIVCIIYSFHSIPTLQNDYRLWRISIFYMTCCLFFP